jgi:3-hydroxybutyryl-CoA dehydrogenase
MRRVSMEIKEDVRSGSRADGQRDRAGVRPGGYSVAMRDIEQRFIDGGMNMIKKNLAGDVKKGRKTQEEMDAILSRITPTLDLKEAAGDADVIVVEVIIEVMDIKKKVLRELEEIVPPTACSSATPRA